MKFHHKLFLLSLLVFVIFILGCGKSVLEQKTAALNRGLPDETSYDVSVYAYVGDRIDYVLSASKIERFYNTRRLIAWNVKIISYDDSMQVKSTILADSTYVDEARNYIQAVGSVVLESPNGKIMSRLITWERVADEIFAPEQVILIKDDKVLRGDNLRTNSSISYAEMNAVSAEGTTQGLDLDW